MDRALALELRRLSRNTSRVLLLWPLLLPRSVAGSAPCFQRGYLVRVLSRLVPYFIFPTRSLVIYNSSVFLFGFLSLTLHLLALPPCQRVQRPHKHLGGTHAVHGKAGHALTCTSHICACQLWLTYWLFSFDDILNLLSPLLHTHLSLILARQPPIHAHCPLYYLSTTADRTRQIAKHLKHTQCQQPPAQHLRTGPHPDDLCMYSGCVIYISQFSFALHTIC